MIELNKYGFFRWLCIFGVAALIYSAIPVGPVKGVCFIVMLVSGVLGFVGLYLQGKQLFNGF